MRSIPPSSSATRATTATAFATTWRSEASNPSSRRDRTVRRQSNTIGKPTSGATSSSDASIASSNSGASPPDTRKPPELTFRCYASQQRNSGSKPSTRPRTIRIGRPPWKLYNDGILLRAGLKSMWRGLGGAVKTPAQLQVELRRKPSNRARMGGQMPERFRKEGWPWPLVAHPESDVRLATAERGLALLHEGSAA